MKNPRQFPTFFYILPPIGVTVNNNPPQIGAGNKFQRFPKLETF